MTTHKIKNGASVLNTADRYKTRNAPFCPNNISFFFNYIIIVASQQENRSIF